MERDSRVVVGVVGIGHVEGIVEVIEASHTVSFKMLSILIPYFAELGQNRS